MGAKLAVIHADPKKKLSAALTKIFTNSTAYHVGWVIDDLFFDMNLIRRKRHWPYYPEDHVRMYEVPVEISRDYLENMLASDENVYGWKDYCLFGLRPIYHLFGKSTPNAGGVICSEMIFMDLLANGAKLRWPEISGPPAPAHLEQWAINNDWSK